MVCPADCSEQVEIADCTEGDLCLWVDHADVLGELVLVVRNLVIVKVSEGPHMLESIKTAHYPNDLETLNPRSGYIFKEVQEDIGVEVDRDAPDIKHRDEHERWDGEGGLGVREVLSLLV